MLTAAALSLLAAGCGGGTSTLSKDEAMKSALDAAAQQVADPSSELYQHRLRLKSATQSDKTDWLVRLDDRTSGRTVCVSIASTPGAVTPSTNLEFSVCGSQRDRGQAKTTASV